MATEIIDEHGNWGKLYESVFERSMVGFGGTAFAVWSYCIAKAKPPQGLIELNPVLIAAVIGDPRDAIERAIKKLCGPDNNTHTKGSNGQRLEHIGAYTYRMVNWKVYRGPKSPEQLREYYRIKQAQYRARKRAMGLETPNIHI